MPADPLRERLKKLVEVWRESASEHAVLMFPPAERRVYGIVAKQVAALLAESEPVDWSQSQELVITADGPLEPEPPLRKARKA